MERNDERSVVDRLGDIEEKVDKRYPSISEQIGENFAEYLEGSTLYYYEPDKRKFAGWRKKKIIRAAINLFIDAVFLIVSIVYLANGFQLAGILGIIGSLIWAISLFLMLAMAIRSKPQMKAQSPLNFVNYSFYVLEEVNQLKKETKASVGTWIGKILGLASVAGFAGFIIGYLTSGNLDTFNAILVGLVGGIMIVLPLYPSILHFRNYRYPGYIFEKGDTRVINYGSKWRKEKK